MSLIPILKCVVRETWINNFSISALHKHSVKFCRTLLLIWITLQNLFGCLVANIKHMMFSKWLISACKSFGVVRNESIKSSHYHVICVYNQPTPLIKISPPAVRMSKSGVNWPHNPPVCPFIDLSITSTVSYPLRSKRGDMRWQSRLLNRLRYRI